MIPMGVYADELEPEVPDASVFKYMRATGVAVRSPISTNGLDFNETGVKTNRVFRPANIWKSPYMR
jgi:hypothetical protein